ncbi:Sulfotransferase 1E1 [Halotydeus destructor]|nr:Sulfotransferase 1E1 [Halotydeus destructor]
MNDIFKVVDGVKVNTQIPEENVIFGLNYKAVNQDVFVSTYPKCGTTWMLQILTLIAHNGEIPTGDLDNNMMFLEGRGSAKLAQLERPFVICTHLPREKLQWNCRAKYVVVARNPKDVLVSYYHHLTKQYGLTLDMQQFRKLWLDGDCLYGNYFEWLNGWAPYLNEPNVKLIFYEDLKSNISKAILDLANFLGYDISEGSPLLTTIIDKSSIDYMRAQIQVTQTGNHLVRKGNVGGWKDELSPEDVLAVDLQCCEKLADGPFSRLCEY